MEDQSRILEVVERVWGFRSLRPIQEQAIHAGLAGRDSLVVLPTGGGKSLCYQAPPLVAGRTDVVVSPLIALMKDQVDGLRECGVAAAALHSGVPVDEQRAIESAMARRELRLVFVAPERLMAPRFLQLCEQARVAAFAVDEAHCISQWGHDFRPEYRQLRVLRRRFPAASLHAFTATATEKVREDILAQLELRDPVVLVGVFDRPNLIYRVVPRTDGTRQVQDVLARHRGEAAIVYCLSRKETERLAAALHAKGVRAACYHAGMDAEERRAVQDGFAEESVDVVVATVAFGMGIDRSDVRCVIHAGMPKSIEHYQQETGRAGRDGLPAECVLLWSPADGPRWESLIERSAAEADEPAVVIAGAIALLRKMRNLASGAVCRHRGLSEYFGQAYPRADCGACDVCLGETEGLVDGTVAAQKILSCVYRTGQRFGAEHVVAVLRGEATDRVTRWGHHQLSTFGLMKEHDRRALLFLVHQLVDSGLLARSGDDRPVLRLAEAAWPVLRGQTQVRLAEPKVARVRPSRVERDAWQDVDRLLFEELRELRRRIARERGVAAFLIFSDATLREMARQRPASLAALLQVKGVGQRKLAELGARFLDCIAAPSRRGPASDGATRAAAPASPRESTYGAPAPPGRPALGRSAPLLEDDVAEVLAADEQVRGEAGDA